MLGRITKLERIANSAKSISSQNTQSLKNAINRLSDAHKKNEAELEKSMNE